MSETERKAFATWAILELMGHRRLAGYLTEQEIAGTAFLRIDVPATAETSEEKDGWTTTQFYSAAAVYAITPCSEATARLVANEEQPEPVHPWELKRALAAPRTYETYESATEDVPF